MKAIVFSNLIIFSLFDLIYSAADDLNREKRVRIEDNNLSDGGSRRTRAGNDQQFPILLPYYSLKDPVKPNKDWGSCLLYAEGLSIIVNVHNKKPVSSAIARLRGLGSRNTFNADAPVSCPSPDKDSKNSANEQSLSFTIDVDIKEKTEAKYSGKVLFSVDGPLTLKLEFKTNAVGDWNLANVFAQNINIKKGVGDDFLDKDVLIKDARPMNSSQTDIGGFYSYNYACYSTPSAFVKLDQNVGVGVSFDNFQFQPFGAIKSDKEGGPQVVRFSPNVNDCVGTFSVGSWMGIIISLILFGVLIFGFLMLNSVQTMDRFDDPKQRQLVLGSKD